MVFPLALVAMSSLMLLLGAVFGQAVSSANFRNDVNATGAINSSDISVVKTASGTQLP